MSNEYIIPISLFVHASMSSVGLGGEKLRQCSERNATMRKKIMFMIFLKKSKTDLNYKIVICAHATSWALHVKMATMLTMYMYMYLSSFIVCFGFSPPKPTEDVLAWTKREIGMMYSFDMISFMNSGFSTQYFCIGVGGSATVLPSPSTFDPIQIDLDDWLQAASYIGAKYAVLVAQHCSGFSMWPTDIKAETGFDYTYSIKYSPLRAGQYDIVKEFVTKCKEYNILPGLYYSLNQNFYLNVGGGRILDHPLVKNQVNVSQELYE